MGNMVFEGIVTSGLGKGAVFMSIDYYKEMIKEKLGFEAYTGTLNLLIDKEQSNALKKEDLTRIHGFKKDGKTFGGVSCYKIKINNIDAAIIIPDLTEHEENMVEVIATVNLKSELQIKDGDKVKIQLIN